jgi:hypothetical protein
MALVDENTAGFMVETVQGEGGMTAWHARVHHGLRKACDEHGMLLILDEIQCGYGRTGKFFAYEHYGIEPDIMTVAKGIGGGFPARRLPRHRGSRQGHGVRHARLDLRRKPARDGSRDGDPRRDARTGLLRQRHADG